MKKIIPPLLALMISFTLSDLIFMMGKRKIYATTMDIQVLSEDQAVTIAFGNSPWFHRNVNK